MKRSTLIWLKEKLSSRSKKPWACFETTGVSEDGRVEFSIAWNAAFIENLKQRGFSAATEEEMVQMFFLSARMLPEDLAKEIEEAGDAVNPEATPNLTNDANRFVR